MRSTLSQRNRVQPGLGALAIVLIALVGILIVGGLWVAGGYNGLVGQQTQLEQSASNVESQLKRRADLIPNLVATVKGYAKHEEKVYGDIAAARSRLLKADVSTNPAEAESANRAMTSSLGRLLAIAENYPNLKADQNFVRLQDELSGTENRINYARIQYNEAVTGYNLQVRRFPNNLLAGMFGFEKKQPFTASETEKATPKVEF